VLVIGLPIMVLTRDAPEPHGLTPDNEREGQSPAGTADRGGGLVHFSLREATATRAFWLITIAMSLAAAVQSAMVVHQFPQLERIVDRDAAALVLAELNLFNIAGRVLGGMLGDRFPKNMALGFNLIGTAIALVVVATATATSALLVYGAIFGFSWGMRTALVNSLIGDYFGRTSFGKIAGLTATLSSPLAVIAPVVVGVAVDRLHGYFVPLMVMSGIVLLGAALFFLADRPQRSQLEPA
jgi:MFS family permease